MQENVKKQLLELLEKAAELLKEEAQSDSSFVGPIPTKPPKNNDDDEEGA